MRSEQAQCSRALAWPIQPTQLISHPKTTRQRSLKNPHEIHQERNLPRTKNKKRVNRQKTVGLERINGDGYIACGCGRINRWVIWAGCNRVRKRNVATAVSYHRKVQRTPSARRTRSRRSRSPNFTNTAANVTAALVVDFR